MRKLQILIADDHSVIREGLKGIFKAQFEFEVVGEASTGEEVCQLAAQLNPDVVILDVSMPGLGGAGAAKRLQQTSPQIKILALSAFEDEVYVRQMLTAGASGYILKRTAATEIARAVQVVADGGLYLDPFVARKVTSTASPRKNEPDAEALSDREEAVLRLIVYGFTNKEIATRLSVSIKSVETYKTRMARKLNLSSRADMVRYALSHGWFEGEAAKDIVF